MFSTKIPKWTKNIGLESRMRASYGNAYDIMDKAEDMSGKSYGLFDGGSKKSAKRYRKQGL